jgi:hypothetical protein
MGATPWDWIGLDSSGGCGREEIRSEWGGEAREGMKKEMGCEWGLGERRGEERRLFKFRIPS